MFDLSKFNQLFLALLQAILKFRRNRLITFFVSVSSTVVEQATYMRVYAGSSPTSADHRKELIYASSCSLNDVKINDKVKKKKFWVVLLTEK